MLIFFNSTWQLCGFIKPSAGRLMWDGNDLSSSGLYDCKLHISIPNFCMCLFDECLRECKYRMMKSAFCAAYTLLGCWCPVSVVECACAGQCIGLKHIWLLQRTPSRRRLLFMIMWYISSHTIEFDNLLNAQVWGFGCKVQLYNNMMICVLICSTFGRC